MFSKERERIPDQNEDDFEALNERHKDNFIIVRYSGKFRIRKINREISKIGDEKRKEIVKEFFKSVDEINSKTGKSNAIVFWSLFGGYMFMNAFHFINMYVLRDKPLTYIYVVWIQHAALIGFLVSACYASNKMKSYITEILKVEARFERKKKVLIKIHEKGNRIDFLFSN